MICTVSHGDAEKLDKRAVQIALAMAIMSPARVEIVVPPASYIVYVPHTAKRKVYYKGAYQNHPELLNTIERIQMSESAFFTKEEMNDYDLQNETYARLMGTDGNSYVLSDPLHN